jgi:endonuclease/exonuclease/phosphatase family metal-dependent hydrolase
MHRTRDSLPQRRRRLALSAALAILALAPSAAARASGPPEAIEAQIWSSAEGCRDAVERGHARMAEARPGSLRLGAWNIEWFPDHTDVGWLACTVAWMNLDLLAVEEFRATPAAQAALGKLLAELERLTGAEWRADLQACGAVSSQHAGFLWNATRLRLVHGEDAWALNARAHGPNDPCAGRLRPGRADDFAPRDNSMPPFRAIAVHLKSGTKPKDEAERTAALAQLREAFAGDARERVVVLGDFNSMGVGTGASARAEVASLDTLAAATAPGFALAHPTPACTEYYRGRGGALDHGMVSRPMGKILPEATRVSGYCALARCAPIADWHRDERPAAYRALSDHCPLVIGVETRPRAREAEAAPGTR